MREAMRLMQTGDLLAATAAIQQRLGGASEPESLRAASVTDPIEGTFRVVDETPAPTQNAPVIRQTVELRNPALMPLSKLQVALLELWDGLPEKDEAPTAPWREALSLSIAGIAAAMQSTG